MKKLIFAAICLLSICLLGAEPGHARSVDNYHITNFDIEYKLGRDKEKRSVLEVKETITADFPQTDQNHGLERSIPLDYQNHPVGFSITRITDEHGNALPYHTKRAGDSEIIRIGDKDTYVHGRTTYVLEYTMRDVTKHYEDTGRDEFYWDTNGTGWRVPIDKLSVALTVEDELTSQLSRTAYCYQGAFGSTTRCTINSSSRNYSVQAENLQPNENVTIAIGFETGTFAEYQPSLLEKLTGYYIVAQVVLAVVSVALFAWLIFRYLRWSNRRSEIHPIVPEYIPLRDSSIAVAAHLMGKQAPFSAQLIDLAVRHYIRIIQTKEKKLFFSSDEYAIEIIRAIDDLRAEEKETIIDIFGGTPAVGQQYELKKLKNNTTFYRRTTDDSANVKELVRGQYALRHKDTTKSDWFKRFGTYSLIAAVVLLSPPLLVVAVAAFARGYMLWPLTDAGLAQLRYFEGLKMYISVAEQDRLRMLQSPEGAAKTGIDSADGAQIVKLYERVLPYAVLFGQEKKWNNELGKYYETTQSQPDWYRSTDNAAFNAAVFTSAMSSFSSAASATSSYSSSSGGSSGGGSSGGGGGGGGGGGW